ncbi:LOW QUALITY PROTEIN: inositol 1,4,5-trisphosphate receptor-interacting protein-like 1 [Cinclus cinclus]|uniref:LOW QUALITY PROTEIN: inositol 1,4,5-trisphosphate receptor-interacting protein-like 1 n=1 Tax=Cinclus cinclus TaxID=127875 RepID=UPI002E153E37
MQGQPLMGEPWAGHAAAAAAAAGALGQALLPASCVGPCPSCPQSPSILVPAAPTASCLPHSPTQGLLSILLQTMNSVVLLFVLLKTLIQYLQLVGDVPDEETRLRMEVHAKHMEWERIWLEWQVEQLDLKQSGVEQSLQLLALAVLLFLVLVLWLMGCKRSLRREEPEEGNNGANKEEVRNGLANEEVDVGNAEEEDDANGEEDGNGDGNVQEDGNVAGNGEDNIENAVVNEAANAANNDLAIAAYEGDNDLDDNVGRTVMQRIQWPVQDLQAGCEWTMNLMDKYAVYFGHVLSNSFYPVLHQAIGVGSAFEGWSPREQDVVYQVLIPMTPPRGHSFHLELDSAEHRQVRNFRVRVQLECTCTKEQQGENVLCFLHQPEEELRRSQDPSLLDTLCTDSYLDVHKTARWFHQLVRAIWPALPQSHNWHLTLLPSRRCCQFQVTNGRESFRIEVLFGVRRGDSDVFVSSQPKEAHTQSTTWPETYAVAETEFFKHVAKQAPPDSLHLKCLQFFTRLVLGFSFSTYSMKTIVMHLLNVVPVSQWRRRDLLRRLLDIREGLRFCVQAKHLNHFIVGNQRLPPNIHLPPDVQRGHTYNLFHRLAEESAAHTQAVSEYRDLRKGFQRILLPER